MKLVQYPTTEGIPNLSPFCVKAETLLRMAKLDYEIEPLSDPSKAQKGKLPMLRDGDTTIPDSEFIRAHLENKYNIDFDAGLSDTQKAHAHMLSRMIEERTYWALVYDRWVLPHNWPHTNEFWFGKMPWPLNKIIPIVAQKQVIGNLKGHGLGKHSTEEIFAFAKKDLAAISTQLADHDFIMGESPCGADATLFGLLSNLILAPLPGDLKATALQFENFEPYVQRCLKIWFPELIEQK